MRALVVTGTGTLLCFAGWHTGRGEITLSGVVVTIAGVILAWYDLRESRRR